MRVFRLKSGWLFLLLLIPVAHTFAQITIHREESEQYRFTPYTAEPTEAATAIQTTDTCRAEKIIFGYHPYWIGSAWQNYQWNLLTDLCYFSYEVDPQTGHAFTLNGWETDPAIDSALAHHTRVHLCVTLFGSHSTFLNNAAARLQLIHNIELLLKARNAQGVNLDFEAVSSSVSGLYNQFLVQFADSLHAALPGCIVSIASPAVDWGETLDINLLSRHLDYFMIMGYDYYWNGSEEAGPVSGLFPMTAAYPYSFSRTLSWYLSQGAKPGQLLMGVPYYGRDWPVESPVAPAPTTGSGTALTYRLIRNNATVYSPENLRFEKNSHSSYYSYNINGWHHCFTDLSSGLAEKYELVNRAGIAGIGIWALGYDNGYTELWDLIRKKFTACREFPCSDTLYDTGGPSFTYLNNEAYLQTISIGGDEPLRIEFLEFNLNPTDTLSIFEGNSVNNPLIGSFTGTTLPVISTLAGNSATFRFSSHSATTTGGWKVFYRCPTAGITPLVTDNQFSVYPNPTSGMIKMEMHNQEKGKGILLLNDINGRCVYRQTFELETGQQTLKSNLSGLVNTNNLLFGKIILPDGKILNFKILLTL